ncbi:MAG: hypothetical protein BV457_04505 [Thermoplasmata archaeon M9B1D]|nr:MAG: hypothetical protein BV457_04505 [Thermoplasmata archaeon M9B1D]PNX50422.1 MAG: hypothetical protein BV456_06785 [Thermoplasmata archaeon M8B2D]
MDMKTSRLLGIIGALFMVIGFLPAIGGILMLIGLIFVIIALKGYGDYYKDSSIFNNTIYTIVLEIIGVVVFVGVIIYGAFEFLSSLGIENIYELNSWTQIDWQNAIDINNILPFVGAIVLGLVILFAFTVIASLFFKKAMNTLTEKTEIKLFHTTGTVFFIGAILTIIFIGFILIWVAFILLLISFYESKPTG